MPLHVSSTRAHRQRPKLYYTASDDEHVCSKHVEAWNKLIIKFSASSWLILR